MLAHHMVSQITKKTHKKRTLVLNGSKGYAMSELINLCSHVGGSSFNLYVSQCMHVNCKGHINLGKPNGSNLITLTDSY